jgi:hypothetical protein
MLRGLQFTSTAGLRSDAQDTKANCTCLAISQVLSLWDEGVDSLKVLLRYYIHLSFVVNILSRSCLQVLRPACRMMLPLYLCTCSLSPNRRRFLPQTALTDWFL